MENASFIDDLPDLPDFPDLPRFKMVIFHDIP